MLQEGVDRKRNVGIMLGNAGVGLEESCDGAGKESHLQNRESLRNILVLDIITLEKNA